MNKTITSCYRENYTGLVIETNRGKALLGQLDREILSVKEEVTFELRPKAQELDGLDKLGCGPRMLKQRRAKPQDGLELCKCGQLNWACEQRVV